MEDCPKGYPRLAAFLDSGENFMIYRRFGYIQSRLLLKKQNDLQDLEAKLERLDDADGQQDPSPLTRAYVKSGTERYKLMTELEGKFKEYGECQSYEVIKRAV